jgi:Ser/Thr protein kinase RdoA (MazF antagonist)
VTVPDDRRADADVPEEVLAHFGVVARGVLSGNSESCHWLVEGPAGPAVLRRYPPEQFGDSQFELDVLRFLHDRGWPVPRPLSEPILLGRHTWGLFSHLPGAPPTAEDDDARRARGRLLARLHDDMDDLVHVGQRPGCRTADEVLLDPALDEAILRFERHSPREGHLLRWHLDLGRELLEAIDLTSARRTIVHSDLASWNLLFADGELCGIVDFAATHLNFAVADFACAWRGRYDAVINGYEEVRPLSDTDRALITPVFWGWLFLGVADDLTAIAAGTYDVSRIGWMLSKLPLRTPAMGRGAAAYPGLPE